MTVQQRVGGQLLLVFRFVRRFGPVKPRKPFQPNLELREQRFGHFWDEDLIGFVEESREIWVWFADCKWGIEGDCGG